ncbi:hypothetical protein Dimus_001990 [Dionaea muscipula]
MSNDQRDDQFRDIHALSPPPPGWDASSHRSYPLSVASENFTTMSREFNALVLAGSGSANNNGNHNDNGDSDRIGVIGEGDVEQEETNPLAIVADNILRDPHPHPLQSPSSSRHENREQSTSNMISYGDVSLHKVKKEEVEAKISAWLNAKIAKINNRFKRDDAIINAKENEEVQKSTSWMHKVERKLEEKRARAMEKMQNDIAKARRKAQERRASTEAKRGTQVARVLEIANLMRTVGRAPTKRSLFF